MSRFHDRQPHEPAWAKGRNKGALAFHRHILRADAEARSQVTPDSRRRSYRLAQAKRLKRPEQVQPAECPWPWKVPYPTAEAAETALAERQRDHGGDWLTAVTYDCPAGAHSHIGHPTASDQQADSEAA